MDRNECDVAWCAGFFDGEGHVSYHRSYPYQGTGRVSAQLYANVPQNSDNIEVLEFFQSIIGFGKMHGPHKTKTATKHVVHYGVNDVEKLLIILKPYLKAKKTLDFQRALMGYWTHSPKPTAEDFARAVRRSKKKGCPDCGEKENWDTILCFKCGYSEINM